MEKGATLLIYKEDTGEIVKEIPLCFWFSNAEENVVDRQFNLEQQNVNLKEGEASTIIIKLDDVILEMKRVMRGK